VEYPVQPSDIDPGPCPQCGGELKWKATVSAETAETHFYQCEDCDHIHVLKQKSEAVPPRKIRL